MKAYVQPSLSSTTFIYRNEILILKFYILSAEEYSTLYALNVQLWSNISNNNAWTDMSFTTKLYSDNVPCF